jgi:hypothetical protein
MSFSASRTADINTYISKRGGIRSRRACEQRFEVSSSGSLVPPTEGSTKPVTVTITNASIAAVEQYDLRMP